MQGLLIRIAAVAFLLLSITAANAQPSLDHLRSELISAWLVTVDGENRTRTLKITGVEQRDGGVFPLDAVYGWTDGNQTAVRAEINQTGQERTLLLTTQLGSQISATQRSDGNFVGTFTATNGQTKGLKLEKLSEGELLAAQSRLSAARAIQKPAADVPASCAAFSGKWTGTWGYNTGQTWLSILGVDANCVAKFTYLSHPRSSTRFETAEIKNGELSIPCGSGTCTFNVHGDEIWGGYSGPEGTNNVVKKRIQ